MIKVIYKKIKIIYFIKNILFSPLLHVHVKEIENITKYTNKRNTKITYSDIIKSLENVKVISNSELIDNIINYKNIIMEDFNNYNSELKDFVKLIKYDKTVDNYKYSYKIDIKPDYYSRYAYLINNLKRDIENSKYLKIIYKYLDTKSYKIFIKRYIILKNIEKSLSKSIFNEVKNIYEIELKKEIQERTNKCEHIELLNKNIDDIIKYYIKEKYDSNNLHECKEEFTCTKCDMILICPHKVFKRLFPDGNLNKFIEPSIHFRPEVYCKICGEFLWKNNLYAKLPNNIGYIYSNLMNETNDNINQLICNVLNYYIFNNNIMYMKKKVKKNSILQFVKDHIYNKLEDEFHQINSSSNQSDYIKMSNKTLILHMYIITSLVYLSIHNNKILMLFDEKVSDINRIMDKIVQYLKTTNKNNSITPERLQKIINAIYDKLSDYIPYSISLYEINIDHIKKEAMAKSSIFNYIFLVNRIYFGEYFDKE